ncbi:ATP-binding protein [Candidatus Margulisiibacteriota bacterium]
MTEKKQLAYQTIIKDVTKLIGSTIALNSLFQIIYGMIVRNVGVTGIAVLLYDEENKTFNLAVREGDNESEPGSTLNEDSPLVTYLKAHKEPINLRSVEELLRKGGDQGPLSQISKELKRFNSELVVPSFFNEKLIGIYFVSPRAEDKPYDADEIELLNTIAAEGAVAIENAKLYQEVIETKDYLKDIIDGSADAIITVDLEGKALSWNQGARDIFGYNQAEIVGHPLIIFEKSDVETFINTINSGGKIFSLEMDSRDKWGREKKLLLTMSPVKNQAKKIVSVSMMLKDISEIRKIEQVKNDFLSMLSHELRTPLNHICGFSELLGEEVQGPLNKEQKGSVSNIHMAGKRLTELINSLLWFSSVEAGKKLDLFREVVSFDKVVFDTAALINPRYKEKNVSLIIDCIDKNILLKLDENQIRRVITIILDNSLKFTPSAGKVEIKIAKIENNILTKTTDNGIGIEKNKLPKIFDKFYQIDSSSTRSAEGIGMGLAMARAIIEAHGGKIWAESDGLGKGSSFIFNLPVV